MSWVPFIDRTDEDSCKTCNGYGGIFDNETMDHEGQPHSMQCPECHPPTEYDSRGFPIKE
jgi:DnaJ-class molecular chaperone